MTTSIITFLVGNPYKPLFTINSGRRDNPRYNLLFIEPFFLCFSGLIVKIDFQNMHHLSLGFVTVMFVLEFGINVCIHEIDHLHIRRTYRLRVAIKAMAIANMI